MNKILIIDDVESSLDYIDGLIKRNFKCETFLFQSPVKGLEWALSNPFDLALLDYHMPELSGIHVIQKLRKNLLDPTIPLVLMLPEANKDVITDAFDMGMSDYLLKPFPPAEFYTRISNLLNLHHVTKELAEKNTSLNAAIESAIADLKESEERYRLALQGTRDGIWDWDLAKGKIFYTDNWCSMVGFDKSEVAPVPLFWMNRVHPDDLFGLSSAIDNHIVGKTDKIECEYRIRHKKGHYFWALAKGMAIRDEQGDPTRIIGAQSDINQIKEIQHKLVHNALHDTLTGLPNRSLFTERVQQAFLRFKRKSKDKFVVLFVDVDKFKEVNDTYGHATGDTLLKEVAAILKHCTRDVDTVARLGGDEFIILLEQTATQEEAEKYIDRLYEAIKNPLKIGGNEISIGFSIGGVVSTEDHTNFNTILKQADIALYQAKENGRNQAIFYERGFKNEEPLPVKMKVSLSTALNNEEMFLHYQPIVNLRTRAIVGYETLLRWLHPSLGLISPQDFLPLAEESDMMVKLGNFVLDHSLEQLVQWQTKYKNDRLFMSINVAGTQVLKTNFIERLVTLSEYYKVDPPKIILEFSEAGLSEILKNNSSILTYARSLGFRLALDDFGSGPASVRSLVDYPLDVVKIDRSLTLEIASNESKRKLFGMLLQLTESNDFKVIVEGIQDRKILEHAVNAKAELGQGYYFLKPGLPKEIEAYHQKIA